MSHKIATIFGGGQKDTESKEYLETVEIGKILAKNNYTVKSGGYYGIMEAVSRGVVAFDGESIGYTCKSFKSTHGNNYLTETIVCEDIYERLRGLIEDSDIFILERGGIGTLSELFLTMDIARKMEKNHRPDIILIGEFWKDIIKSVSVCFNPGEINMITVITDYKDIEKYL